MRLFTQRQSRNISQNEDYLNGTNEFDNSSSLFKNTIYTSRRMKTPSILTYNQTVVLTTSINGNLKNKFGMNQTKMKSTIKLNNKESKNRKKENTKVENKQIKIENTIKKNFHSSLNPNIFKRINQKDQYLWYAAFDNLMIFDEFLEFSHINPVNKSSIENRSITIQGWEFFYSKVSNAIIPLIRQRTVL